MAKIEIYIEPSSDIRALFEELSWDNRGFKLATIEGDLADVKLATAILAATSEPQLAAIGNFSLRAGGSVNSPTEAVFLFMTLDTEFVEFSNALRRVLEEQARNTFVFRQERDRMLMLAEVPLGADSFIPGGILTYLNEPIEFDRLTVETDEDVFHYSL